MVNVTNISQHFVQSAHKLNYIYIYHVYERSLSLLHCALYHFDLVKVNFIKQDHIVLQIGRSWKNNDLHNRTSNAHTLTVIHGSLKQHAAVLIQGFPTY